MLVAGNIGQGYRNERATRHVAEMLACRRDESCKLRYPRNGPLQMPLQASLAADRFAAAKIALVEIKPCAGRKRVGDPGPDGQIKTV